MARDSFDHLGDLQIAFIVNGVYLDPGALLALLVAHLAHIGVDLVDRQAWAGFNVAAVLNLNRPLVTSGEFQVLQRFLAVVGIGFTDQAQKLDGVLDAWVFRLVLVI